MIAIPNMEMPKSCAKCKLVTQFVMGELFCDVLDKQVSPYVISHDCPLIEIVRCEECKWFELDVWGELDGIPLIVAHEMCKFWGNGCKTNPNGFCSYGERK